MGFFSGVGNIVSSLTGGYIDNYYNRKAAKKQYNYQMAMWEANNAYNTPAEQMKRLREAGLNPNLVYGGGSATHTATMASAPSVQPGRSGLNADTILKYQQSDIFNQELLNLKATNRLINAQTDAQLANAGKTAAEAVVKSKNAEIYKNTGINPEKASAPVGTIAGWANSIAGVYQDLEQGIENMLYDIFGGKK